MNNVIQAHVTIKNMFKSFWSSEWYTDISFNKLENEILIIWDKSKFFCELIFVIFYHLNWLDFYLFLQPNDQHYTKWYHQHPSIIKHGQILERSTCHLCHTKTCGGTSEKCAIQTAGTYCRYKLSSLGSSQTTFKTG